MASIKSAGDRIAKTSKETENRAAEGVSRIVDQGRKSVEDVESKAKDGSEKITKVSNESEERVNKATDTVR